MNIIASINITYFRPFKVMLESLCKFNNIENIFLIEVEKISEYMYKEIEHLCENWGGIAENRNKFVKYKCGEIPYFFFSENCGSFFITRLY